MILMNDFVSMINGMKVGLEHSSQINILLVIFFFFSCSVLRFDSL